MGASASELPEALPVEPGGEAVATVRIRNSAEVVDRLVLEVLGEAADWTQVEPPALSLFPDAEGEAILRFRPPRLPTTAPGLVPFGLRVRSEQEQGAPVVVEEGSLVVAPFYETAADVMPRTSRGRRRGRHELAFDNRGNTTVTGLVGASSPESQIAFRFQPGELVAPPGTAVFAKVAVRPRRKFLRGAPLMHVFQIHVESEGAPPAVADAYLFQEPLLPRLLLPAVVAIAALVIAWALVLKPKVKPTAKALGAAQTEQVAANASATAAAAKATAAGAAQQAAGASKAAQQASATAAKAGAAAAGAAASVKALTASAAAAAPPKPFNRRLVLRCPPRCSVGFTVPPRQKVNLTDVVFGNPLGDAGLLRFGRENQPLLVEGLANFHDLPLHFSSPLVLDSGQKLVLSADCANAVPPNAAAAAKPAPCTPAALVTGTIEQKPKQAKPKAKKR